MPETMVERIAKALSVADGMHPDAVSNDEDSAPIWTRYINDARAALQALREPTEAMLGAFDRMCDDNGQCLVKSGYRAMIDAALSEGAER